MKVIHHIKIHKRLSQVSLISGFLFCLLVLATFYPLESKNEHSTEAATGSAQSSSLTLDVASSVASVDLTVDSSTGTFASSDTNAAFSVTTNNFTGYTLSISADEDTGLLSDDEANTLSSIPAAISEETFSASTNTSYNGMWGYRPSKYNSAANTNYLPAPTTTASTLDVTSTANTTANNYTIALGARADFTKPSASYTNTFIITAVSNPINYVIKYDSNTTDTVTDMPATQSSSTSATSIVLSNNTPKREHHTFNGWCSVAPTTTNGDDVCNGGTVYLAGATYGIDQTTLNDTTLYAMWNIDKFVQTTQVRYENADGTWGSYSTVDTKTVNYGSDYSWSTSQISGFDSAAYKAGSVSSYTVTADKTNQVSIYRNTFTCNIQSRFQNADGTYGSYTTRVNETRRYGQTCSWSTANIANFDSTTYKAASYTNNSITANVNQSINIDRNTFACTARYRLQNADGTYPTTYTSAGTVNSAALYGSTCSYTTNQNTTQYQNKTASATVTKATTLSVDVPRVTYACTARYKLQNADGTYPSSFTTVSINSAALYGSTCSYTTAQDTTKYTNQSASATVTGATTLTVGTSGQVPRKTYKLTVTASTNTSSPTGAGTYRWGQTVAVGVTKATNTTCISYAAPTWTKTAGTLSSTSGTSVNFTMPTSAATVTAASTATNTKQTITFKTTNATTLTFDGTSKSSGNTASVICGTYNIAGSTYPIGYEFSKWSATAGSFGSTTTSSTTYNVTGPATVTLTGKAKNYTQTTQVRYENADGTWGSYSTVETKSVAYGSSYSWSTSQITGFNSTAYKAGSVASYTVTADKTNQVSIYRQTYECKAQYKLQAADGTYPSTYTTVTVNSALRYGSTCSYTTTQNTAQYTNQTASATVNGATTLTLPNVPRKTYKLTVTAGTNTSSPTGAGTYRWGQTVTVGVTKAANTTCISYAAPTWTKTAGTLSSTSGTSVNFTMPTSAATVTAASTATNNKQTITLSRSNASSISIGGTAYTATSVELTCGSYNITGAFASGYEFSSWAITGTNNSVASTSTLATTLTVGGAGTLTLTGKSSATNLLKDAASLQAVTTTQCSGTTVGQTASLKDTRDNEVYLIGKLADGKCWMLDNLRLGSTSTTALTPANTNIASNYTLPAGTTSGFTVFDSAKINVAYKNDTTTTYGNGSGKVGVYYNYCAATAGTYCYAKGAGTGNASYDICPKNWRMPTSDSSGEYQALYTAYSSNATNFRNALSTPLSGNFNDASQSNLGSGGYFWSSTYNNTTNMYYLGVFSLSVSPSYRSSRYLGFSVRCVLK